MPWPLLLKKTALQPLSHRVLPCYCQGARRQEIPAARDAGAITLLAKFGAVKAPEPTFVKSGIYKTLLETPADKMRAVRMMALPALR